MFCKYCGKEDTDGAKFCSYCGNIFNVSQSGNIENLSKKGTGGSVSPVTLQKKKKTA